MYILYTCLSTRDILQSVTCSNSLTPSVKVKYPASNKRAISKAALIVFFVSLKLSAPAVVVPTADTHSNWCSRPFIVCDTGWAGQCSGCGVVHLVFMNPHHQDSAGTTSCFCVPLLLAFSVVSCRITKLMSVAVEKMCTSGLGLVWVNNYCVWRSYGVHAGHNSLTVCHNSLPVMPFILYTEC